VDISVVSVVLWVAMILHDTHGIAVAAVAVAAAAAAAVVVVATAMMKNSVSSLDCTVMKIRMNSMSVDTTVIRWRTAMAVVHLQYPMRVPT
jgi:transposase